MIKTLEIYRLVEINGDNVLVYSKKVKLFNFTILERHEMNGIPSAVKSATEEMDEKIGFRTN